MPRLLKLRVFGLAILTVIVVGAGVACAVVLVSEPANVSTLLRSWEGIESVVSIALMASLPMTVVGGVVAGVAAVRALRTPAIPLSRREWLERGLCQGGVLGGCVATAYFGVLVISDAKVTLYALAAVLLGLILGAVSGAMSGVVIGAYCTRFVARPGYAPP